MTSQWFTYDKALNNHHPNGCQFGVVFNPALRARLEPQLNSDPLLEHFRTRDPAKPDCLKCLEYLGIDRPDQDRLIEFEDA